MDIFDILTMIGGLCLFLYGMNVMGQALERLAGGKLQSLLGKLTTGKIAGLLTGLGVTAVIQSSSATQSGIATAHSLFNLACTILLLPLSGLLEKLAYILVPETAAPTTFAVCSRAAAPSKLASFGRIF